MPTRTAEVLQNSLFREVTEVIEVTDPLLLRRVMNSSLHAVAFGHVEQEALSKRCVRRRVGLRGSVPDSYARGRRPQRDHDLREVFDGLRWIVRTGSPWRYMPHDLPPWEAVYQQTRRWLSAGVFEEMVHDLRVLLRLAKGRMPEPTAAIFDSRTLRSTPESGSRGGYDGHKRKKKGSKVHAAAVDTLGHLLALRVTAASEQERSHRWRSWPKPCKRRRASRWNSLTWTRRATQVSARPKKRRLRASAWRWSSTKRPSEVSCSLAAEVGGGAGFRMGIALSAFGEGLREATRPLSEITHRRVRVPLPSSGNRHPRRKSLTPSRTLKHQLHDPDCNTGCH